LLSKPNKKDQTGRSMYWYGITGKIIDKDDGGNGAQQKRMRLKMNNRMKRNQKEDGW
jgi:hypothetical protein